MLYSLDIPDLTNAKIILRDEDLFEYLLIRKLGVGAYGQVYTCAALKDSDLCAYEAVKIFSPEANITDCFGELSFSKALHHTNLLPVRHAIKKCKIQLDDGTIKFFPVIFYHHAGNSLASEIDSVKFSPIDTAIVGCSIARALEHIDKFGFIHGDIKPGNILSKIKLDWTRDQADRWMLGDFGTLRSANTKIDKRRLFPFTRNYAPPEYELHREGAYNHAFDIYSLGQTLRATMVSNINERCLEEQKLFGRELYQLFQRCISNNPDERPAARELALELEDFICKLQKPVKPTPVSHTSVNKPQDTTEAIGTESTLFNLLVSFVQDEYRANRLEYLKSAKSDNKTREQKGFTLSGLQLVKLSEDKYGMKHAILYCDENKSSFRIGDQLALHIEGKPPGSDYTQVELLQESRSGTQLTIGPGFDCKANAKPNLAKLNKNCTYSLSEVPMNLLERQLHGLTRFAQSKNSIIVRKGMEPVTGDKEIIPAKGENARSIALDRCLNEKGPFAVQGPAGTGKTSLLAEVAIEFAAQGKNVFVTALSHMAVNNALLRIKRDGVGQQKRKYIHTYKSGGGRKNVNLTWGNSASEQISDFAPELTEWIDEGIIVGAVVAGAAKSRKLDNVSFDVVLIEEASQLTVADAASVMWRGERVVLFGDHKQLGPIIQAPHVEPQISQSIFSLFAKHYPYVMLDTTYRLNKDLCSFPSSAFYQNRLKPADIAANRRFELENPPNDFATVFDPEASSVFINVPIADYFTRSSSAPEADVITQLVMAALESGAEPSEIAVLTPFRAQGREIRSQLSAKLGNDPAFNEIVIDTVDRLQGQEREMIFFSFAVSDPEYAKSNFDFLFDLNRLNVCITRARSKLIGVGYPGLFELQTDSKYQQDMIQVVRNWRDSCQLFYDWEHKSNS